MQGGSRQPAGDAADRKPGPTATSRALRELARSGALERIARGLDSQFQNAPPHYSGEDAVQEAVARTLPREVPPDGVEAFVARVAYNAMLDRVRQRVQTIAMPEESAAHTPDLVEEEVPEGVIAEVYLREIRKHVARWKTASIRATMLVVIDSILHDDPIDHSVELARRVSRALGREVSPGTARKWLSRGVQQLDNDFDIKR